MFFFKYLLILQYKISYFLARIRTYKERWDFIIKLEMAVALGLYFMVFYLLCCYLLENLFNLRCGLFGDYGILIYFLICSIIFYKLNLTWIRAIELTKNQKSSSRTILLVLMLILAFTIYTSIKK
jgi:hypothetical protein